MIVAGIDPGKKGAIVKLNINTTSASFYKLKYNKAGFLDTNLSEVLSDCSTVYVEHLHGRGGNSATSTFMMGYYYGQLMNVLNRLSTTVNFELNLIKPEIWTRLLHKDVTLKTRKPKLKTLEAYKMIFPHDPVPKTKPSGARPGGYHDGVIDALMIAIYPLVRDNEMLHAWRFD